MGCKVWPVAQPDSQEDVIIPVSSSQYVVSKPAMKSKQSSLATEGWDKSLQEMALGKHTNFLSECTMRTTLALKRVACWLFGHLAEGRYPFVESRSGRQWYHYQNFIWLRFLLSWVCISMPLGKLKQLKTPFIFVSETILCGCWLHFGSVWDLVLWPFHTPLHNTSTLFLVKIFSMEG